MKTDLVAFSVGKVCDVTGLLGENVFFDSTFPPYHLNARENRGKIIAAIQAQDHTLHARNISIPLY